MKNIFNRLLVNKVNFEEKISVNPVSSVFGFDRGTPIDRIYIDMFLKNESKYIQGDCLEIEENTYTKRFGKSKANPYVLKYSGEDTKDNIIVADLTDVSTLPESRFDTFICTQTLNFIYDVNSVSAGIYKLLKPGGVALITVAGISQISMYDHVRWGDFWRFTDKSLLRTFSSHFNPDLCSVITYGNVATSCLFLQGASYEDVKDKSIFNYQDPNYQLLICARIQKD